MSRFGRSLVGPGIAPVELGPWRSSADGIRGSFLIRNVAPSRLRRLKPGSRRRRRRRRRPDGRDGARSYSAGGTGRPTSPQIVPLRRRRRSRSRHPVQLFYRRHLSTRWNHTVRRGGAVGGVGRPSTRLTHSRRRRRRGLSRSTTTRRRPRFRRLLGGTGRRGRYRRRCALSRTG